MLSLLLITEAHDRKPAPDQEGLLQRRALDVPAPDVDAWVLVRTPTSLPGLKVTLLRGPSGAEASEAPLRAPSLGLVGLRAERGEKAFHLHLSRQADLPPSRPSVARVSVLVFSHDDSLPRLVSRDVPLRADGEDVDLAWNGTELR